MLKDQWNLSPKKIVSIFFFCKKKICFYLFSSLGLRMVIGIECFIGASSFHVGFARITRRSKNLLVFYKVFQMQSCLSFWVSFRYDLLLRRFDVSVRFGSFSKKARLKKKLKFKLIKNIVEFGKGPIFYSSEIWPTCFFYLDESIF